MVAGHNFYMQLALDEAWKYQGLTYPNPAVGCCIVDIHGAILSVEAHQRAGEAHAEVQALKSAYHKLTDDKNILTLSASSDIHNYLLKHHNNIFKNIILYTTLEPCSHIGKTPSCASLIIAMGIAKVYVGSRDFNPSASDGNALLCASNIDVENSILKKECDALLMPFVKFQKRNFIFFKWAQRLNGTLDDGVITSKESRYLVHQMRSVCDLMVIGGDTLRKDRPILDARLCDGKSPDVLIYTREKKLDTSIPLFHVKNREVIIADNLDALKNYKNIMIEGGSKMYMLTRDIVDNYLCFLSPKFGGHTTMNTSDDEFEILNINQESQDIIMWMKRV